MKFRDFVFWPHLVAGVSAGIVVLILGVTGFLLMFERQISGWADTGYLIAPADNAPPLTLDELVPEAGSNGIVGSSVVVLPGAASAVAIREGRSSTWINPWDGTAIPPNESVDRFYSVVQSWHRWFGAERDNRDLPRSIVNVSNLVFLFLALSGIYLWLPRVWNKAMVRSRVFFRGGLDGKARDFNWHHVFAFWTLIPLVFIIYTGAMIYYPWAREAVHFVAGVEPQQGDEQSPQGASAVLQPSGVTRFPLSLDEIRDVAAGLETGWKRLQIDLPGDSPSVSVTVDTGNGAQLYKQTQFELDVLSGDVVSISTYEDLPTERKIFGWQRFGHTGEAFGVLGQLVAGLVSLASAFMVWTGLALAWRRLISPLLQRRRAGAL